MTELKNWVESLRREAVRSQPFQGQSSPSTNLVIAWARVESVSSSGVVVTVAPYGEERDIRLDGWLTTVDPNLNASEFVQIGGPRLEAGDDALVALFSGYLLAIGKRGEFVRREPMGVGAGRVTLVALPARISGGRTVRLLWNYVPNAAADPAPEVDRWLLVIDGSDLRDYPATTRAVTLGVQDPGSQHSATIEAFDADGVSLGTASAAWEIPRDAVTPPAVSIAARTLSSNSARVTYSATGATVDAWRFYADNTLVTSGTSPRSSSYIHRGLAAESTHTYRIEADYTDENDVTQTVTADASVVIDTAVSAATIDTFTATAVRNVVTVTWATSNCDTLVLQRKLSTAPDSTYTTIHTPANQAARDSDSYTDTVTATPGTSTQYTYRLVCGTITATAPVTVTVPRVDAPVLTLEARPASITSVQVVYSVSGAVTEWRLYVDTADDFTGGRRVRSGTSVASGAYSHTGLTAGGTYRYRLEADYLDADDATQTARVQAMITLGAPSVTIAAAADLNVVTVSWTSQFCESLILQRKPEGEPDSVYTTIHTPEEDDRATGSYTDTIDLDPGEEESYTYRIVCGSVTAEASATASLPEEDELPLPTVALSATAGLTTISATWETTGGELTAQTVSWTATDDPLNTGSTVLDTEARSHTITGLTPGTEYNVTITVTNSAGSDSDSAVATTGTIAAPTRLACGGQTTSSFRVTWSYSGTATFEIRIRETGELDWGNWIPQNVRVHTFRNLGAATEYDIQVRSVIGTNRSPASDIRRCETTGEIGAPVLTVTNPRYNQPSQGDPSLAFDAAWTEPAAGRVVIRRQIEIRTQRSGGDWMVAVEPSRQGTIRNPVDPASGPWTVSEDDLRASPLTWPWFPSRPVLARVRYQVAQAGAQPQAWSPWSPSVRFVHGSLRVDPPSYRDGTGVLLTRSNEPPRIVWVLDAFDGIATPLRMARRRHTAVTTGGEGSGTVESSEEAFIVITEYPSAGTYTSMAQNIAQSGFGDSQVVTGPSVTNPTDFSGLRLPPWWDCTFSPTTLVPHPGHSRPTTGDNVWRAEFTTRTERTPTNVDGMELDIVMTNNPIVGRAAASGGRAGSEGVVSAILGTGSGAILIGTSAALGASTLAVSGLAAGTSFGFAGGVSVASGTIVGSGFAATGGLTIVSGSGAAVTIGATTVSTITALSGIGLIAGAVAIIGTLIPTQRGQGHWEYSPEGGSNRFSTQHRTYAYVNTYGVQSFEIWSAIIGARYYVTHKEQRLYSPASFRVVGIPNFAGLPAAGSNPPYADVPTGTVPAKTGLFVPVTQNV